MKSARIYAELAEYARRRGYEQVTESVVHDWRRRGMMPDARNLKRRHRRPGQIPHDLRARADAICEIRYRRQVRDLRVVTLLLWLDGVDIEIKYIRDALEPMRHLAGRLVALAGSRAKRMDTEDVDADVDAAAGAMVRIDLAAAFGGDPVPVDALRAAVYDALRLSLGRSADVSNDDLEPLAMALGLGRAHEDEVAGAAPWLATSPGDAVRAALLDVFGPMADHVIAATSDADLLRAREAANRLHELLDAFLPMFSLAFPRGQAGLGALVDLIAEPDLLRPVLLYQATLRTSETETLVDSFEPEVLSEWREATVMGHAWLQRHPQSQAEARERGLLAVVRERYPE